MSKSAKKKKILILHSFWYFICLLLLLRAMKMCRKKLVKYTHARTQTLSRANRTHSQPSYGGGEEMRTILYTKPTYGHHLAKCKDYNEKRNERKRNMKKRKKRAKNSPIRIHATFRTLFSMPYEWYYVVVFRSVSVFVCLFQNGICVRFTLSFHSI